MRPNTLFEVTDEAQVRALIAANPFATIVSTSPTGELVASHYPVLIDDQADELTLLTHVGRPDDQLHGFRGAEVVVIFTGTHGYISPTWYSADEAPVPTWNFSAVHAYGTPEVLSDEENLAVLARLTAHFEAAIDDPRPLDPALAVKIARGTVGLRIPVDRFTCKVKMSQNKSEPTQRLVIEALEAPGPYRSSGLAAEMRTALGLE